MQVLTPEQQQFAMLISLRSVRFTQLRLTTFNSVSLRSTTSHYVRLLRKFADAQFAMLTYPIPFCVSETN